MLGLNTNGSVQIAGGLWGITETHPSFPFFSAPKFIGPSSDQLDGWGRFNFVIDNVDGFSHSLQSLTFTLKKTSGVWSSDQDVLTLNAKGHLVAAHVFVADAAWTNTNVTGYATHGAHTPEPSALVVWLLTGVSGLVGWRRRQRIV